MIIRHLFYKSSKSRHTFETCKFFISDISVALVLWPGCRYNVSGIDEKSLKAT
jgi:hypothetical protein